MKKFISYKMKTLPAYIVLLASLLLFTGCATTTPLMRAAAEGDIKAVKDLLDKGDLSRQLCMKRPEPTSAL